ncbi:3-dehydroquinate dehydratase [Nonlabens sp. Hel1_33_55]|uniref:type II 3-dehydroquinate dehydratase n=1 Tax=Nonlabens sp. Hel1_33_55 TaxID=1336802 RepID=UPI000875F005|nr:type II 3-dehydroquinate dehydratase [Nonlabens sp. Hel1_33_55]SCX90085.1 3-dehydroquinate dehydratase [Nonlabens sp. Hel1_33_55]
MKLLIINGPNLNLLGKRQPEIYGSTTFEQFFADLQFHFQEIELASFQSNVEGELINKLHEAQEENFDGVIINPGAYTHTSLAIADAVSSIETAVVEVHISNVMDREEIRHISMISKNAAGTIAGFGLDGYKLAIQSFLNMRDK